jgi:hypothetical protein
MTTDNGAVIQSIVSEFVAHRASSVSLIASAVVARRIGRGDVVKGYRVGIKSRTFSEHCWYRLDNRDFDLGTIISTRVIAATNPECVRALGLMIFRLSTERPLNYAEIVVGTKSRRGSGGTDTYSASADEHRDFERDYSEYVTSPAEYWARAPSWVRRLAQV